MLIEDDDFFIDFINVNYLFVCNNFIYIIFFLLVVFVVELY